MKQILQNLGNGNTELVELPCPQVGRGELLIRSVNSLLSSGTERMLVDFGKSSLLTKARKQPEKVKQVLNKIKTDGFWTTIDAVSTKLNQPIPLGYCNAGLILTIGEGVTRFRLGDRVVSNGPHAEVVCVPDNLCAKIPDDVKFDEAVFTVAASIGLQGIRLLNPTMGECIVVTGLGLIGLVTIQLLKAQGCRVMGIDFEERKTLLASSYGIETVTLNHGDDPISAAQSFSRGRGVDGVLITASTKSDEPVHQAAQMCRKRGRIVLVGITGLQLSRDDFYEKELSFQVSCSYGPGRYDNNYEIKGFDYPIGFVRWTEQRNFEAVLDLLADEKLCFKNLISHTFSIDNALKAYKVLYEDKDSLGIVIKYKDLDELSNQKLVTQKQSLKSAYSGNAEVNIAAIGAGNYASRVLLPILTKLDCRLKTIVVKGSASGVHTGRKLGFEACSTNIESVFADEETNTVLVLTRHDNHASLTAQALLAGKNVFVEKPLGITFDDLDKIEEAYKESRSFDVPPKLMIGFNRRFSPFIQQCKKLINSITTPKSFIMTINAGKIPDDHWTQDSNIGGGRIIGEACHFIDLLRYLTGSAIDSYTSVMIGGCDAVRDDKVTITLSFKDGSFGTIHYLANGHSSFPKERLEVFCDGRVLQLDNFKTLVGYGWPSFKKMKASQDKGHKACIACFINSIKNGSADLISFDEIMEVSRATIDIAHTLR